ncbi:MAG: hypothetical protein ACK416_03495, partial [Zestosphaera sp.]
NKYIAQNSGDYVVLEVMWFAFVNSPLGTNLRVLKKFLIANTYNEKELEILSSKVSGFLGIRNANVGEDDTDLIYEIISIEPDAADLIKLGLRNFLIAELL